MMIRTTQQELIDNIKDMTRELPDCGHSPSDPNDCYICYGKAITTADQRSNLIITDHKHDSIRLNKRFRKKGRIESLAN